MPPDGIALEEARDRRLRAQRLQQLDLGVGQRHEHDGDAVRGLRHGLGDLGTQRGAILGRGGGRGSARQWRRG